MKDVLGRSQYSKVLTIMLRSRDTLWWHPPDFMRNGLGDMFVGYEASSRLSEMARKWPQLIETRQHPTVKKYKQRRLRWENLLAALPVLPDDLHDIILDETKKLKVDINDLWGSGIPEQLL